MILKFENILLLSSIMILSCGNSSLYVSKKRTQSDTLLYSVSAKIKGQKFKVDYRSSAMLFVINLKNDTILRTKEEGLSPKSLLFEDYNNDGYLDIRYGYNSNYFYETILLFEPHVRGFRKIEGIDNPEYANSKNINGTDLYFSFSPNGCGKNNWISILFKIKDFKLIQKGISEYNQCVDDEKGMFIYRLNDGKKELFEKIELNKVDNYDFENYWKKNYKIACP